MNENLEELKGLDYCNYYTHRLMIRVLEDFEKRLKTIEDKMGLFPLGFEELPKGQRTIKPERMNHLEKGVQIGKSREGPKSYKSGCDIKPKTLRPKPKPRPQS